MLLAGLMLGEESYAELFRQAAAYSQHGEYGKAIEKYKAALVMRPNAPEALNNLAVMYYETRQYREALDSASKIWESHPELKSAALIAGMAAVQCNRPKEALRPLEQLLGQEAANQDALLALASARFALKDLKSATELWEREVQLDPKDSKAWYGLGVSYESMAEEASRRLSKMAGGAGYSKRLLGEYLQSAGDSKLAAEAFGQANGASASAEAAKEYELARALADKSRDAFEHFVNLAPNSWQAALFLGDVDRQHGDLQGALKHYGAAAKEQPENAAPLVGLGTAYWELGEFDQATTVLHRALKLNPHSAQAIFELANIAVRRHEEGEAIPLLKEYLAEQPDALGAHADLGRAYFHLKRYGDAAGELGKAAAADESGDIHYELSVALRNLGRLSEANDALKESKAIREARLKKAERLQSVQ